MADDNYGYRWGYTFLRTDTRLSFEDRHYLLGQATEMYLDNEEERAIKTDTLEGRLTTQGRWDSLGSFGGQRFEAEIESKPGKVKLCFLVSEQSGQRQDEGRGGHSAGRMVN